MLRRWLPTLLPLAVFCAISGTESPAHAQWAFEGYYNPVVVTYQPVNPVAIVDPYPGYYVSPYPFGGYGIGRGYAYGVEPRVVRDRYHYGFFGHYHHHHVARGPGFGRFRYYESGPGYYGYARYRW